MTGKEEIRKVAVIGAGMMGAEIGLCFALSGREVLLKDISLELVQQGKDRLHRLLEAQIQKGRIPLGMAEVEQKLASIVPIDSYDKMVDVDCVIEAVIEELSIKKKIFNDIDVLCKPQCIFASNTSSLSITEISSATSRPDRFIGMHFFSPATLMKLVEIVPGEDTSEETINTAMVIARSLDKEPVLVKECIGFAVNRLLVAMLVEGVRLVEEGIATPEDIDKAMRLGCGHPVGPFQLMDLIGLDLNLEIMNILHDAYGERFHPPSLIKRKVGAGHLGRKAERGWFNYRK
jgi:3-hydroxybutyryl-CoA dehydrogenase